MASSLKGQDARNGLVRDSSDSSPSSSLLGLRGRRLLVLFLLLLVVWIAVDFPYQASCDGCGVSLSEPVAKLLFRQPRQGKDPLLRAADRAAAAILASGKLLPAPEAVSPGLDEEDGAAAAPGGADPCEGRYVYMYNMPPKFNADFLADCKSLHPKTDMCPAMSHSGTGEQAYPSAGSNSSLLPPHAWSDTDQFSLDVIVHARMKEYACLTRNASRATAFFVPYYANLDLFFDLYSDRLEVRDKGAREAVQWLQAQPAWHRRRGRDHIIVLGRVMWDFTRTLGDSKKWGCNLMSLSYMRQVTVLTIESSNSKHHGDHVHSIPYPSFFHPTCDADVAAWQAHVRARERPFLVGFAARGHGVGTSIRERLERVCAGAPGVCQAKNCGRRRCMRAHAVMWLYLTSRFCFQPPGDTPTRKAIFDCMLGGGIPVFFTRDSAHRQYYWHLPGDWKSYSILIPKKRFDRTKGAVAIKTLQDIPNNVTQQMRETIIGLIPNIAYALPGAQLRQYRDAFDIAIDGAVASIRKITS